MLVKHVLNLKQLNLKRNSFSFFSMNRGLEKLSDEELFFKMKNANGDFDDYFSVFYDRYNKGLYTFSHLILGNKRDAEDNVQETFEKFYKNFIDFNPKYAFTTWIYAISKNNAINKLRKKNNVCFSKKDCFTAHAGRMNLTSEDITIEEYFSRLNGLEDSPEEKMILEERNNGLINHLPNLKRKDNGVDYGLLLNLKYLKEKSYEEISKELEIPVIKVKGRLHKARKFLKRKLSGKNYV